MNVPACGALINTGMKLAVVLCLVAATASAAPPKTRRTDDRVAPQLVVTARVAEIKGYRACGVVAWRDVVRYEVLSVDSGKYSGKDIFIVETCPEFLKVGQKKKMALVPVPKDDTGFGDKFPKGPRYLQTKMR